MKTFHNLINVLVELCDSNAITSDDVLAITEALVSDGFLSEKDSDYVCEAVAKESEET